MSSFCPLFISMEAISELCQSQKHVQSSAYLLIINKYNIGREKTMNALPETGARDMEKGKKIRNITKQIFQKCRRKQASSPRKRADMIYHVAPLF